MYGVDQGTYHSRWSKQREDSNNAGEEKRDLHGGRVPGGGCLGKDHGFVRKRLKGHTAPRANVFSDGSNWERDSSVLCVF